MKLKTDQLVLSGVFLVVIGVLSGIPAAEGQTTVGGHVGFVLPLVTHAAGQTTNIADNFSIGFPLGVTFKGKGRMAYDLELVPGVQGTPRLTTFTRHLLQGVFRRGRAAGPLQSADEYARYDTCHVRYALWIGILIVMLEF